MAEVSEYTSVSVELEARNPLLLADNYVGFTYCIGAVEWLNKIVNGGLSMCGKFRLKEGSTDVIEAFWMEVAWRGRVFAILSPSDTRSFQIDLWPGVDVSDKAGLQSMGTARPNVLKLRLADRLRDLCRTVHGADEVEAEVLVRVLDVLWAARHL